MNIRKNLKEQIDVAILEKRSARFYLDKYRDLISAPDGGGKFWVICTVARNGVVYCSKNRPITPDEETLERLVEFALAARTRFYVTSYAMYGLRALPHGVENSLVDACKEHTNKTATAVEGSKQS
jgi:hypothetical protein